MAGRFGSPAAGIGNLVERIKEIVRAFDGTHGHTHDGTQDQGPLLAVGAHDHDADYSAIDHDHDDEYLALTGGTLTGDLAIDGGDNKITFGGDTNIYRAGISTLQTDDYFRVSRGSYLDPAIAVMRYDHSVVPWLISAQGVMEWGSGSATRDTNLYRSAENQLKTDDALVVAGYLYLGATDTFWRRMGAGRIGTEGYISAYNSSDAYAYSAHIDGDTQLRFYIRNTGTMAWGSGSASADTLLYRSAANQLRTDDNFVALTLNVLARDAVHEGGLLKLYMANGGSWYNSVYDTNIRWHTNSSGELARLDHSGNWWVAANCSALSFTDRTPMPSSLAEAYAAVGSLRAKAGKPGEVDHEALAAGIQSRIWREARTKYDEEAGKEIVVEPEHEEVGRDLSATVSALMMVVEDLTKRISQLEAQGARGAAGGA